MNRSKRKRLIAAALLLVAVGACLIRFPQHTVTTLHLDAPVTDGTEDELWFNVRSPRILSFISTEYGIEAHTIHGLTNYDAPPFGNVRASFSSGMNVPVRVAVPKNADSFRVKVCPSEYGALYSKFEVWAHNAPFLTDSTVRTLEDRVHRMHHSSIATTVWSPWIVRSNSVWVEKFKQ
jgi:hypothetical protein